MTRSTACFALAMLLLAGAGLGILWPAVDGVAPSPVLLELLPKAFEAWRASDLAPEDVLPPDTRASAQLARTYRDGADTIWVAVGYYGRQAERNRPAARDLLFPGRGWTEVGEHPIEIRLDGAQGAALQATLVTRRGQTGQIATVYWYELPRGAVAGDQWYRLSLLAHRLVGGRTDGALVRVATPVSEGATPDAVVARYSQFIRVFHPELRRVLFRDTVVAREVGRT